MEALIPFAVVGGVLALVVAVAYYAARGGEEAD